MAINVYQKSTSWCDYVTRPRNENHMQSKLSMSKRNGLNWMNHHLTIIAWWNFFWYAEGQNFDRYFLYGDVEDLAFFGFTLFRNKTNNFTSVLFFSVINRDGSENFFLHAAGLRSFGTKNFLLGSCSCSGPENFALVNFGSVLFSWVIHGSKKGAGQVRVPQNTLRWLLGPGLVLTHL